MGDRGFEVEGADRAIRRKLKKRIQYNISFDNKSAGVVKDACSGRGILAMAPDQRSMADRLRSG